MKTIKLTNEMAAALYLKDPELRTTLLHDFTDEELGIKSKPLKWKDLGEIKGRFVTTDASISIEVEYSTVQENRNIYPSVKDAEKALAHCQLLQLAKHYNKCDQHEIEGEYYSAVYDKESRIIKTYLYPNLHNYGGETRFINESELLKCVEDNRELWEIYLGAK